MSKARDSMQIGGAKNIVIRNSTFDSWIGHPDGSVEEKHQRLNPKTMKWEDRKPKCKRVK